MVFLVAVLHEWEKWFVNSALVLSFSSTTFPRFGIVIFFGWAKKLISSLTFAFTRFSIGFLCVGC